MSSLCTLARAAVATCAILVLLPACSPDDQPPEGRDPLRWPYPADSIWNHPRGDSARLVPFSLEDSAGTVTIEEDLIVAEPSAPTRDVLVTTAGWRDEVTRCGEVTDEVLTQGFPIPYGWTTDPGYTGETPNHAAAVVLPDLTLAEAQPLHVCPDGTVVAQEAQPDWQGSSIVSGATGLHPDGGSHGGSGMTAFGGTIRMGEWVPGGRIPHALKLTVDGRTLSATDGGFRWPALNADAYYAERYRGSVPEARMGALLTVPPWFDVERLDTEAARILADAMQQHGAYVVDDRGYEAVGVAVEWGPAGRVRDEFEQQWGFPLAGHVGDAGGEQLQFLEDVSLLWSVTHVVDDNAADTVGGAGEPMAAFAPPLDTSVAGGA